MSADEEDIVRYYDDPSFLTPFHRFHERHGMNVRLSEERTAAMRTTSFAHALTFSERPLQPGELFLLQIQCTESGWSGALRIGLTQHHPDKLAELPTYAMPDLSEGGQAWICAVNKTLKPTRADKFLLYQKYTPFGRFNYEMLLPNSFFLHGGSLQEYSLAPMPLSTDRGSRVGVYFLPRSDSPSLASMHVVANGMDCGAVHKYIPYREAPLWVVVDVYGTTKEVKIVQLYDLPTLQSACKKMVLKLCSLDDIDKLPLPEKLKLDIRRKADEL